MKDIYTSKHIWMLFENFLVDMAMVRTGSVDGCVCVRVYKCVCVCEEREWVSVCRCECGCRCVDEGYIY